MERVQPYEKRWWALGVLILSLFVISLDNTIMNVTLPTLVRELGASATQLQWIVDAYVLVFAGLLLTAGGLRGPPRPAHRHACIHGDRRGPHHAGHAVDPHERVPRRGASSRDRDLVGRRGPRLRARPGARRLDARAGLVGGGGPPGRAPRHPGPPPCA